MNCADRVHTLKTELDRRSPPAGRQREETIRRMNDEQNDARARLAELEKAVRRAGRRTVSAAGSC